LKTSKRFELLEEFIGVVLTS